MWPNLRYYPSIFLQALRKRITNHRQDSQPPGLNQEPFRYEKRSINHTTVALSGNIEYELISQYQHNKNSSHNGHAQSLSYPSNINIQHTLHFTFSLVCHF